MGLGLRVGSVVSVRAQVGWLASGRARDPGLLECVSRQCEVNRIDGAGPGELEVTDLLLVELDREGGDALLAQLEEARERGSAWVVLDRGASQRQLAEAFRLGARDCLSRELEPGLAAERIHHLCRRILADRSFARAEGVR